MILNDFIINEKEKNEKKIGKLQETLREAENSTTYQLLWRIINSQIYMQ